MKTKQSKDEQEKGFDEDSIIEPKTRARKKASDNTEDDKKSSQDEPKSSKETKRPAPKTKTVKKRPLGIRKTLRGKQAKTIVAREKVKKVIKQTVKRGRKPAVKIDHTVNSQDKEAIPLIPASEIKKEPLEDLSPNSRSSSPKTAGRRQRLSSDLAMMKTMLSDSPSTLVIGPRTSPYSMRSERSNSPSLFEAKNLRSGKPRKLKTNLLNEVVMKEQKKRRRLNSDCKTSDTAETPDDCKKRKRGRSCSHDGSEISKCSDNTESDLSMNETLTETEKELNKNKPKTDLDLTIENNIEISTIDKVPSVNSEPKFAETKHDSEPSSKVTTKDKKKLSLKRSTSLDSDNNNSNRNKLETLNSTDQDEKMLLKTDLTNPDSLLEARSSILTCMSKTFNSKQMSKNIRKARRGRKAGIVSRAASVTLQPAVTKSAVAPANPTSSTATSHSDEVIAADTAENADGATETIESLTKEINDLINDLDQNIDRDHEMDSETTSTANLPDMHTKTVSKFYGLAKPLNGNSASTPDTPLKDKDVISRFSNENTPSKIDDSENIRLHYEEDSVDKPMDGAKSQVAYKCSPVASIDKLMDRLKEFEELDKRRQLESKVNDGKPVMVTSDVVLIPKSGDIKPLKDIQSIRSPEMQIAKENVLSCFENNSAISILKRDQVRKSIDIDLPNSVTLIKRNNLCSRKESTSSNHSSDAISIFEKSLGKDVTLTEIRKSTPQPNRESAVSLQVDLHQFATLHPNASQNLVSNIESNQISITPCVLESKIIAKRKSRESLPKKSSESAEETTNDIDDKMATIEKITSSHNVSSAVSITPAPVTLRSSMVTSDPVIASEVTNKSTEPVAVDSNKSIDTTPVAVKATEVALIAVKPTQVTLVTVKSTEATPVAAKATEVTPIAAKVTEVTPVADTATEANPVTEKSAEKATVTIKSPDTSVKVTPVSIKSSEASSIAIKSPEVPTIKDSPPSIESIKTTEEIATTEMSKVNTPEPPKREKIPEVPVSVQKEAEPEITTKDTKIQKIEANDKAVAEVEKPVDKPLEKPSVEIENKLVKEQSLSVEAKPIDEYKPAKSTKPKSARNSIESQPGPSNVLLETPERQEHKESVLRTLGLLTHKAAKEAKIEKLKEKERIYGSSLYMSNKNKSKAGSGDYTGTLKTVIKLNRGVDKKKQRSSLKMTFQKSKYRTGKPTPEVGDTAQVDEAYYTIERREGAAGTQSDGGQRKSHYSNRLNNHEAEAAPEPSEPKETLNLVIPEKASSFSIHPGRLCMDQCFYCGGKFGLFDTPCHIAQIKSLERQKKILTNEEKLTDDSCLCDACYRHVDRRANCPSYRKRPIGKLSFNAGEQPAQTSLPPNSNQEKPSSSPPLEEDSEEEPQPTTSSGCRVSLCHGEGCTVVADHSIRRKWLIKLRPSVNKLVKLKGDYPGLHTIPLCADHYRRLTPLMACVLCRRKLTKHHNLHFIHYGYLELNPLLAAAGLPVQFLERPVLCKACRYYCTLLKNPTDNTDFVTQHRIKLLHTYNIELPAQTLENETGEHNLEDGKAKKKHRTKSKQSSSEPENSESSERTSESTPEKDKPKEQAIEKEPHLEEDIESLISSNKILVPNATKTGESATHSDGSENENAVEVDAPLIPIDKQTELQYLLQKQNNPAQFLPKTNLTQKQRNILKLQNPGIQKQGLQHRVNDKNAKKIQKLGQIIIHKERQRKDDIVEKVPIDGLPVFKNISLNEECTIESIPNKRPADIHTLKNKWEQSESFCQVKKNLSELSKNKEPNKKASEAKYSNPVKRLETNPSISVRELFPGEEEMNLQCNIEFNNIKGVTPQGWEKCNTMIQYDVETKKLWSELQRPYGNQSSFLRHLILLEKYFRNGDLILSHNASPHAANYSDSVQSRLKAYDNVPCETPKRTGTSVSLIEYRKKPSINGKSLLKSNQSEDKETKKFMPPPGTLPRTKSKVDKSKSKPLPPELIAINTPNAQGRKAIQNVLHNIQQLVKGVSASDPTEIAAAPLPPTLAPRPDPPVAPAPPPKEKKELPKKDETPKKTKTTSKPWRPALMPITPENLAKIAREPSQVAVDGRTLPSLVQVMSAGQRFHITLQDYNKMCVMRREKLQQIRDGEKSTKRQSTEETTVVTEIQPSTMLGNGGTVVQNITSEDNSEKKDSQELSQIGSNAANILKNVGLKNITIAPIPPKTATITSQTVASPLVSSPSLLVTSTPIKIPQLGPAVSIVSESPISTPVMTSQMIMPKIPKSLTVIPQTMVPAGQMSTSGSSMPVDSPRP